MTVRPSYGRSGFAALSLRVVVVRNMYFCIGAAKTGTTILARLLDQQPQVACMWEAYFLRPRHGSSVLNPIGDAWKKHGLAEDQVIKWHHRATERVVRSEREVDAIHDPTALRAIVSEVFDQFAEGTGKETAGDKWPYYSEHLELLVEAFPDARFVYNVRDARAVWNSGQTFRDRHAGDLTLEQMVTADERVRKYLGDERFLVLKYEDLIIDTARTMETLSDFIGFDYHPESLKYNPRLDPLPDRWNWVPTASRDLDPDLTEKWRHEMSDDDQKRVTEACADFLATYGYIS